MICHLATREDHTQSLLHRQKKSYPFPAYTIIKLVHVSKMTKK